MAYSRFSAIINFIFPQRSNAEQNPFSFGTHVYNTNSTTANNISTKLQLERVKLHIEIVNLKPVTLTTILPRKTLLQLPMLHRCAFLAFFQENDP